MIDLLNIRISSKLFFKSVFLSFDENVQVFDIYVAVIAETGFLC